MEDAEDHPDAGKDEEKTRVIRSKIRRRRLESLGRDPEERTCKNCGNTVTTEISRHNGPCVWFSVFAIIFIAFPFFWVPLIIPRCKDVLHSCPRCGSEIGIYTIV